MTVFDDDDFMTTAFTVTTFLFYASLDDVLDSLWTMFMYIRSFKYYFSCVSTIKSIPKSNCIYAAY